MGFSRSGRRPVEPIDPGRGVVYQTVTRFSGGQRSSTHEERAVRHSTDPEERDELTDLLLFGVPRCVSPSRLPCSLLEPRCSRVARQRLWSRRWRRVRSRSEEHTSELQSLAYLVCRLLLEKKKKNM